MITHIRIIKLYHIVSITDNRPKTKGVGIKWYIIKIRFEQNCWDTETIRGGGEIFSGWWLSRKGTQRGIIFKNLLLFIWNLCFLNIAWFFNIKTQPSRHPVKQNTCWPFMMKKKSLASLISRNLFNNWKKRKTIFIINAGF